MECTNKTTLQLGHVSGIIDHHGDGGRYSSFISDIHTNIRIQHKEIGEEPMKRRAGNDKEMPDDMIFRINFAHEEERNPC